jgi:uncharacterized protein
VAERPVAPMFADVVPQILAIVHWDEGPRFSTEIINSAPDQLRVGMRVRTVLVDLPEDEITMLFYEPAGDGSNPVVRGRRRVSTG